MKTFLPLVALCGLLSAAAAPARANDFPTSDRVLYVQECMRANPGPYYEIGRAHV